MGRLSSYRVLPSFFLLFLLLVFFVESQGSLQLVAPRTARLGPRVPQKESGAGRAADDGPGRLRRRRRRRRRQQQVRPGPLLPHQVSRPFFISSLSSLLVLRSSTTRAVLIGHAPVARWLFLLAGLLGRSQREPKFDRVIQLFSPVFPSFTQFHLF